MAAASTRRFFPAFSGTNRITCSRTWIGSKSSAVRAEHCGERMRLMASSASSARARRRRRAFMGKPVAAHFCGILSAPATAACSRPMFIFGSMENISIATPKSFPTEAARWIRGEWARADSVSTPSRRTRTPLPCRATFTVWMKTYPPAVMPAPTVRMCSGAGRMFSRRIPASACNFTTIEPI